MTKLSRSCNQCEHGLQRLLVQDFSLLKSTLGTCIAWTALHYQGLKNKKNKRTIPDALDHMKCCNNTCFHSTMGCYSVPCFLWEILQ